jgi:hypothetical protein
MSDPELYMAREGYIDYPQGPNSPTPVRARAVARAGHPIIARTPYMWVPLVVDYEVEQPQPKAATPRAEPAKVGSRRGAHTS